MQATLNGMTALDFPPFRPHPLLRGGHAQTIAGAYARSLGVPYAAEQHLVALADGDQIVLHDDCPDTWPSGGPIALLIHGLGGSHRSLYMVRVAAKLNRTGVRVFRMDLRGCGAGFRLARRPCHAGRSEDAAAAVDFMTRLCPGSPLAVVGFSLAGNVVLKLAGEWGASFPANVLGVMAVSPPLRIRDCVIHMRERASRFYTRNFLRTLLRQTRERQTVIAELAEVSLLPAPAHIYEFDDRLTAPLSGFTSADEYYERSSAAQYLPDIHVKTLVIAAADDPLIPVQIFQDLSPSAATQLHITQHGGHLGYLGAASDDPDRRWLDWRIVDWIRQLRP